MNKKLQAVHHNRCARIKRNYDRFMRDCDVRKRILSDKYHYSNPLSSKMTPHMVLESSASKPPSATAIEKQKEVVPADRSASSKHSNYLQATIGHRRASSAKNNDSLPDSVGRNSNGEGSVSPNDTAPPQRVTTPTLSPTKETLTSWAKVVKSPTASDNKMKPVQPVSRETFRTAQSKPLTGSSSTQPGTRVSGSFTTRSSSVGTIKKPKNHQNKLEQQPSSWLFVGNLTYSATEEDIHRLKSLFTKFGRIKKFVHKQEGAVWIRFENEHIAVKALKVMDQKVFLNRPLYVDFSKMPHM